MRALLFGVGLLALLAGPVAAAELGRLFLTPAERGAIDAARRGVAERGATTQPTVSEQAQDDAQSRLPEPPAEAVTVNGYIARSAGAATVWVNGRDMAPGKLSASGRDGRRVNVPLGGNGGQVALKPGQSFDPESRQVSDAYQQRPPPHE